MLYQGTEVPFEGLVAHLCPMPGFPLRRLGGSDSAFELWQLNLYRSRYHFRTCLLVVEFDKCRKQRFVIKTLVVYIMFDYVSSTFSRPPGAQFQKKRTS